jgi:hypothetical protein
MNNEVTFKNYTTKHFGDHPELVVFYNNLIADFIKNSEEQSSSSSPSIKSRLLHLLQIKHYLNK